MRYAFIQNDVVADIETRETPLTEMYHEDLIPYFVECGDVVQVGWVYVDGVFNMPATQPEPETIENRVSTLENAVETIILADLGAI